MPLDHNPRLPLAELDEQLWLCGLIEAGAVCCRAICHSKEGEACHPLDIAEAMRLVAIQTGVGAWIREEKLFICLSRPRLVAQLLVECLHKTIQKCSVQQQ